MPRHPPPGRGLDLNQGDPAAAADDGSGDESRERRKGRQMGLKDILVTLDAAPSARPRIELAATLAARFDAHLIGLHTTLGADLPRRHGYFEYFDRSLLEPLYREAGDKARGDADRARAQFEEVTSRCGVSAEWRAGRGYPTDMAALHGRYADLIVLGQLDPDEPYAALFRPLPEEVALAVGRPILVVPYAGAQPETGR